MAASPIDLIALPDIKSWLSANGTPSASTSDDGNLQLAITAVSRRFLNDTGRGGIGAAVPSSLNSVINVNENYDGNGNDTLFLRETPIVSVTQLLINGVAVVASSGFNSPGYLIDSSYRSLVLRGSAGFSTPPLAARFRSPSPGFSRGTQNINVQYTAGYDEVPEDLFGACCQMVAQMYKRKGWIDQKSQALSQGAGTVSYRDWDMPPEVVAVLSNYKRVAFI